MIDTPLLSQRDIPVNFSEYSDSIMSNFDHQIDYDVAKEIKDDTYYAQYAGWNFCGWVWWEDDMWHCKVMVYGSHRVTISSEDLEDIMEEVCSRYGND